MVMTTRAARFLTDGGMRVCWIHFGHKILRSTIEFSERSRPRVVRHNLCQSMDWSGKVGELVCAKNDDKIAWN